ncbi:MAG: enoyl-CoA hydratase/isomerase family protein, partial [Acidimicrobiaceae bacterium]|nr:enoyl-CoA hydratase/isomerase family protein [Acidimicrobiaceae bacterium]
MSTPPDFQTIKVTCDGRRGTLTLNRPDRLNALSNQLMAEVAEAASWFDHQSDLRVVIVSGAGRAFSAGFDLSVFGDDGPSPAGGRV